MKKMIVLLAPALFLSILLFSQIPLTVAPSGGNKNASVSERIGLTDVTIHYDRPGVKGREGKIYNTPVAHYGFADQGHGTSKAAPWRAGANENTVISFSHPVKIEGKDLPAGKYALFTIANEGEWTIIFNKTWKQEGVDNYKEADDALRVKVKPGKAEQFSEKMTFIINKNGTVSLLWGDTKVDFTVS